MGLYNTGLHSMFDLARMCNALLLDHSLLLAHTPLYSALVSQLPTNALIRALLFPKVIFVYVGQSAVIESKCLKVNWSSCTHCILCAKVHKHVFLLWKMVLNCWQIFCRKQHLLKLCQANSFSKVFTIQVEQRSALLPFFCKLKVTNHQNIEAHAS